LLPETTTFEQNHPRDRCSWQCCFINLISSRHWFKSNWTKWDAITKAARANHFSWSWNKVRNQSTYGEHILFKANQSSDWFKCNWQEWFAIRNTGIVNYFNWWWNHNRKQSTFRLSGLIVNLADVGMSNRNDLKTREVVVPAAILGQAIHHGISRNVKHISLNISQWEFLACSRVPQKTWCSFRKPFHLEI
jgi:uncharacterized membrane protein (DUF2068 family)